MAFWRKFISIVCIGLLFDFVPNVQGQVLTLNQNEYVKVEAKLNELVPYHRYKSPINLGIWDNLPVTAEAQKAWRKYVSDTAAIKIQDDIIVFFVWKNDTFLRVICRREASNFNIKQKRRDFSIPVTTLVGQDINVFFNRLNQLQRKSSCIFIGKPYQENFVNSISNPECITLVVQDKSNVTGYYRIFNITSFKISKTDYIRNQYYKFIIPDYSFSHQYAGFSLKEVDGNVKSKPSDWQYKLTRIYDNLFLNTPQFEGSKPISYFNSDEIKTWPWNQSLNLNYNFYNQFSPLYFKKRVVGYQAYNKKLYPETEGYNVVPGKFFLPRRLKIISVNDIPWENF